MKKLILVIPLLFAILTKVNGQDVIVKKDGSSILSRVLEVNPDNIRYKKYSNLDGPVYTVSKSDVLSVNYQNGEIEKFGEVINNVNPSDTKTNMDYGMKNDELISNINDRSVKYLIEKSDKKAKWLYRLIRIHNQSEMVNEDAKISVFIDHDKYYTKRATLMVDVENNTDELLFLDLGNCFFRRNNAAASFFTNSSTTTTTGGFHGWSFGTSTIGSILGIKGSLFNRSTFGGGVFNSKSTTVYAERIVAIAPHTKYSLPWAVFYEVNKEKPYKNDFKLGERYSYQQPSKFDDTPWEIIISYANEKNLDKMKRMRVAMYIAEEMTISSLWKDSVADESEQAPLHYFYKVDE